MNNKKKLRPCGSKTHTFSLVVMDSTANTRLEGVTFELRDRGLVIATAISDINGVVTFENIDQGTYTLHETIVPDGYIINPEIHNVLVRGCNRTTINGIPYRNFTVKNELEDFLRFTFDPNGVGHDSPVIIKTPDGSTITAIDNPFTTVPNHFLSWNTKSDGTGITYNPGDVVTVTTNMTLYARWQSLTPEYRLIRSYDVTIIGTGFSQAQVSVMFPNGQLIWTTVDNDNNWSVNVPVSAQPLLAGQQIRLQQIQPNMEISGTIYTYVSS